MSLHANTPHEPQITLCVSLTVEADYRSRAAFPGLRIEHAKKRVGTFLLFDVPLSFADSVLEDAENRMEEIGGGRGVYQAYRALHKRLSADLDEVDGVEPDPGREAFIKSVERIGVHPVGTVLYSDEGEQVTITHPLTIYPCSSAQGAFRRREGRFDYRPMYLGEVVRDGKKESFAWAPGALLDKDGGITHLRLVHSA